MADWSDGKVSVLAGDGKGGFGAAAPFPACKNPRDVVAVDLNRDGALDLALACWGDNVVAVLLANLGATGKPDGTFGAPATFPVGTQPFALVALDLDGACGLDLAVSNWGSANVTALLDKSQ